MKGMSMISLILLACIGVGGIIGSTPLAESANPKQVELVGSKVTHMGRSPGEHVMLEENIVSPPPSCNVGTKRIFPDGSKDSSAFVVPPGKVFIVTDIVGVIGEDVTWAAGDAVSLRVIVHGPSNQQAEILMASVVLSPESANSDVTVVNPHSQSGGLAGPGTTVCLTAFWNRSNSGGAASVLAAHLEGYLIDE